jgi:hypothetical protein
MIASHLSPCPGCSRHVRVSEGMCPFCGVSLGASFRASPAPVPPSRRLSRAALFALGAGTAVLGPVVAEGCGFSAQPMYGGSAVAPYGAEPFPEDAGGGGEGGSYVLADVQVGSIDAAALADAGSAVEDTGSDSGIDGAESDAESDAQTDAADAD